MKISNLDLLLGYVENSNVDAIVVEGYDSVGKGRLLNILSEKLGVIPYRPDYNLWQKYDHRNIDRWKISGFFWDVFSHFDIHPDKPMLFDRGVLSGSVYNQDLRIADDYNTLLRDCKVLHILVTCNFEDYCKFQEIRNADVSMEEIEEEYSKYIKYTDSYVEAFERAGVNYISYQNEFDNSSQYSDSCISCGHYNYGYCRHPEINFRVNPFNTRCNLSRDKEVQDIDTEMQCV